MDNDTTGRSEYDDEIDRRELSSVLWGGKLPIALVNAFSAVIAVLGALYLPNKYTSEALLAPRVYSEAGESVGQLVSPYGGLASLADINLVVLARAARRQQ